jgi:FtsZ-interacting cell division protein ZipA
MTPITNDQEQYMNYNESSFDSRRQGQGQPVQPFQQPIAQQTRKLSVDPTVKNSAIYNKYFKSYKDPNEVREVRTPKTKEELVKMLIEDHNNRIDAQKRLAQVKSKKMFFFGPEGVDHRSIGASQNHQTFNKLFHFK